MTVGQKGVLAACSFVLPADTLSNTELSGGQECPAGTDEVVEEVSKVGFKRRCPLYVLQSAYDA